MSEEKISNVKLLFDKCKVCNHKASGLHYGIPTCEACKVN